MSTYTLSVLSVEPYGMKRIAIAVRRRRKRPFSALGRAVWDETHYQSPNSLRIYPFSALGRAVWDETFDDVLDDDVRALLSVLSVEPYGMKPRQTPGRIRSANSFQCSRSSRMG